MTLAFTWLQYTIEQLICESLHTSFFQVKACQFLKNSGANKPETMRELTLQLVTEATAAPESAARNGEQSPPWV